MGITRPSRETSSEGKTPRFSFIRFFDWFSSKPVARYSVYSLSLVFFFALILTPTILGVILKWNTVGQIFESPQLLSRALSAIYASFAVAIFVSTVDVIAGIPMAWFIARGKTKWLYILDTLVDMPFILPTVTLGYSFLLFWSESGGISSLFGYSLLSPGWILVILLHFAFSYPIVVRMMVGKLLDLKPMYEEAARSLGAAPFTVDRTIILPILKSGVIASFTLAFARSLSETGATLMVAGSFENGPIFINNAINMGYEGALVFVSLVLISVSCIIYTLLTLLSPKLKVPMRKVWPIAEREASAKGATILRNCIVTSIFLVFVLAPSIFIAIPVVYSISSATFSQALMGVGIWQQYWNSFILSYAIGAVVTLINLVVGLPMAIFIARKKGGTFFSTILDVLVNVPIIIPSIALGASIRFFWRGFVGAPELLALVFAHSIITYPYIVRTMASAIGDLNIELEDSARTLGGRPLSVFRTITLPLTKYSLISGAIMAFTRSVDETGATLAVTTHLKTVPVLLVDWVRGAVVATPLEIGFGCSFLIILSFGILLALRTLTRRGGRV